MDHRDWLFLGGLASDSSAQTQDDPTVPRLLTNLPQIRENRISEQMELGKLINWATKFVQERVLFPLGEQIHEFMLGDQVWVKDWKHDLLSLW